jgi:hypothetical protein
MNAHHSSMDELVCCCPETLSLLYVKRSEAVSLLGALKGAIVVAQTRKIGNGWRARQVADAAMDAETGIFNIQLCDGSSVSLTQLSDCVFHSFNSFQLRSLCCELSWRMVNGFCPRLRADEVRVAF